MGRRGGLLTTCRAFQVTRWSPHVWVPEAAVKALSPCPTWGVAALCSISSKHRPIAAGTPLMTVSSVLPEAVQSFLGHHR